MTEPWTRYRVVAVGESGRWTVALVRSRSMLKGKTTLHHARSQHKDTLGVTVYRERFNAQGMTTEREEV